MFGLCEMVYYLFFILEYWMYIIFALLYPFQIHDLFFNYYYLTCTHVFRADHLGFDNLSGGLIPTENWVFLFSSYCCLQLFIQGWDLVNFPPSTLAYQLALLLCRSCLGNHVVEISWVQGPCHVWKTLSCSRHPGPLLFHPFSLLFHDVPGS